MSHILFGLAICVFSLVARADDISVATAANFIAPLQMIAALFERDTGHKVMTSYGSTGKFYSQIANGAPFDILLAADDETPAKMEKEGLAVVGTHFTYAVGKLVLWSADTKFVDNKGAILKDGGFKHLSIANPKTAPYGTAAVQAMTKLGLLEKLQPTFVQGDSITQAYQFIATGSAELGFVAYSQVIKDGKIGSGSGWFVSPELYDPILQNAVLLIKGKDKPAAQAFLNYLKTEKAKEVIRSFGYGLR
jgi:molybdate transport system substrate-binding protein